MSMPENDVVRFIEPIYRFCLKRVNSQYDAEDLAGEIIVHVLDGLKKYHIDSLDAWVWRVAHNRYARWCRAKNVRMEMSSHGLLFNPEDDYDFVDHLAVKDEFDEVFRYLHTLSSGYKNILVDYYIGEMSIKHLSEKYVVSENTIKWRLNVSRTKIKERIGENNMDKIYKRINWNTDACNGSMDSNAYLNNQVARAICKAAYEKPLTVEEISLMTGLPTMYIEDVLPRLIYGDAIDQIGNKYATNFIILRLSDKENMEKMFAPLLKDIAEYFEQLFVEISKKIEFMDFYGHQFGMPRLGYIVLPYAIRKKIGNIKSELGLTGGPYPPRKDGGYGWFIVEESKDEQDLSGEYRSGCNITYEEGKRNCLYYYWMAKYFSKKINHNMQRLIDRQLPQECINGVIPDGLLSEDDRLRLLQANLIVKSKDGDMLHFPHFTQDQFAEFSQLMKLNDEKTEKLLVSLVHSIHKSFIDFVPKRLDSQINQWVSSFVHSITCYVAEELISRGVLEAPGDEKPLVNGVFYVEGKYISL